MTPEDKAAEARRRNDRAQRQAAARAAAAPQAQVREFVSVRVTRRGEHLVCTGEHAAGVGDLAHDAGARLVLEKAVAEALEERGFVDIDGPAEAPSAPQEPAEAPAPSAPPKPTLSVQGIP